MAACMKWFRRREQTNKKGDRQGVRAKNKQSVEFKKSGDEVKPKNSHDVKTEFEIGDRQGVRAKNKQSVELKKSGDEVKPKNSHDVKTEFEIKKVLPADDVKSKNRREVTTGSETKDGEYYYATTGKRGLLCILQHIDEKDVVWKEGSKEDKDALKKFFQEKLQFHVEEYSSYKDLATQLENDFDLDKVCCLMIFISSHGHEKGIETDDGRKTIHEITKAFGNGKIKKLSGAPKIFILDACRGDGTNRTVERSMVAKGTPASVMKSVEVSPTTDSDCLIIHATTHGYEGYIQTNGSVGVQGVIEVLNKNWEEDHLEEMLIDARMKVAEWRIKKEGDDDYCRQTLEIQTTLVKRLKLRRSNKNQNIRFRKNIDSLKE